VQPTFADLMAGFLSIYEIEEDDMMSDPESRLPILKPDCVKRQHWVAYHNRYAELQWLCPKCHLDKTKGAMLKTPAQ
jgi:hypothetical protein